MVKQDHISKQAQFFIKFDLFMQNRGNKTFQEWVMTYLNKKGIVAFPPSLPGVQNALFKLFENSSEKATCDFFNKMEKAWNAYSKRQTSKTSMLNVSISAEHKAKFLRMAKDAKCTNITMLEALIDSSYKTFILTRENELKRIEEKKEKRRKERENQSFTNKTLSGEITLLKNSNQGLKSEILALQKDLYTAKENSKEIFEIIDNTAKNNFTLTPERLIQAAKAYGLIEQVLAKTLDSEQVHEEQKNLKPVVRRAKSHKSKRMIKIRPKEQ